MGNPISRLQPDDLVYRTSRYQICDCLRAKAFAEARNWNGCSRKTSMATGTVKWFNTTKGYGFIQPEGGGKDVFVHISAVERAGLRTLNEGQQVSFELKDERGKTAAVDLKAL